MVALADGVEKLLVCRDPALSPQRLGQTLLIYILSALKLIHNMSIISLKLKYIDFYKHLVVYELDEF